MNISETLKNISESLKPIIKTLNGYIGNFYDRRLLTIFLFGIASGFPAVMIFSAMSAWLKDEQLSRTTIGVFGLVASPYAFNFLWAPLVDRLKLPLLYRLLGQRRSWIALTQVGVAASCLALASINISTDLALIAVAAVMIGIFSATQDIAIDAYRIDIIPASETEKTAAAAAMATSGWWTGYAGLGAITFILTDYMSWPSVYLLMAVVMICFVLLVLQAQEPESDRDIQTKKMALQYQQKFAENQQSQLPKWLKTSLIWLTITLVEPFKEFFDRNGVKVALSLLLFILLFKIGEAFLGRMSITFYKEIGFSNADIGFYSKLISWGVIIAFSLIGSVFIMHFGIVKGLFIGGIAMASSNLMFAAMAMAGPNLPLFIATVIVDGYTSAWGTVAFVAFISMLCNRAFTASQYALMASLGTLGKTVLGSSSGAVVDYLNGNWVLFFLLTTVMVIPSLIILYFLKDRLNAIENSHKTPQNTTTAP
jgi:PAT family beta-lactamase induction signal transducer AmpG